MNILNKDPPNVITSISLNKLYFNTICSDGATLALRPLLARVRRRASEAPPLSHPAPPTASLLRFLLPRQLQRSEQLDCGGMPHGGRLHPALGCRSGACEDVHLTPPRL